MTRSWIAALFLALAAPATNAAGPAATDAEAMWRQFLARGDYAATMAAYDTLVALGYDGDQVDAAQCARNAGALDKAIETVPVSIALRRAAYLCADAGSDPAATERALEVLASLSRHALKQAGEPRVAQPIRVVAPADAYALLLGSGLQETYEYYLLSRPERYFPLVLVGWDADTGVERHLGFDYVDTLQQLRSEQPHRGMPIIRGWIAEGFLGSTMLASVDLSAVRASSAADNLPDKLAKVRGAAMAGGVQSAKAWLLLCAGKGTPKDCDAGLVDALLTQAEDKQALPMALLAFAYADGLGVKANPDAALALLEAAERRWPDGALAEFFEVWVATRGDAPLPGALRQRFDAPIAAATSALRRLRLQREVMGNKPRFSEADMAFLADSAQNGRGTGYGVLADYFVKLDQQDEAWKWAIKAADAGNPGAQAWYASALIYGDRKQVPKNRAKGREMAEAAAHGGDAWSARWLSNESVLAGDFRAAEGWLFGPADAGNIDSIMQLAGLYLDERPNVSGDAKRAVELYRMLAGLDERGAPARRALAELALQGIGMPKDPAQAIDWLKRDAERGDARSQIVLGGHYLRGDFGRPDEAEGSRWMQRAMKAGEQDAVTSYGSWLYYEKNTAQSRAQALEMFAGADAAGNEGATNNYAWVLCTSPLKEVYDPRRGLEVSRRLGDVDQLAAGALDTVAACYAANGDFARAVELQTRAARELAAYDTPRETRERDGKEPGYVRRLGLYKAGKRYEEYERNQ